MEQTTITLHTDFTIGRVDPRIFGGFLENMGRAVYEGVYEPGSGCADADGFRSDVCGALDGMKMTAVRWPGGNFASGYHWRDGVEPAESRPTVLELAWNSKEPNHFGTDEFVRLCRKMNWMPVITVNLGTGTPAEAGEWVEYCNRPAGTRHADMRAANGCDEPYGVPLWCLGNEMYGQWQLGHVPASEYAIRAQQAGKIMKDVDNSTELVVCGAGEMGYEWDVEVLEYVGELADYLSVHRYVGNRDDDTANFLAVTNSIDRQIEDADSVCRFIQAKRRSGGRPGICFDEWNVWYRDVNGNGEGRFAPHILEEVYNLEDALVVAGFLNSFIRHADMVKVANLAQIVNVIGPVLTRGDEMLIQSILHPFAMFSARRDGVSLRVSVAGPGYESKEYGAARYVDCSAILGDGVLHVFAINRSLTEAAPIEVRLCGARPGEMVSGELLTGPDAKAANSFEEPSVVEPVALDGVGITDGGVRLELPPLSVAAMTLKLE